MAFISDPEQRRTYDPDRNIELTQGDEPTGSSGYRSWHLTGPDFDWQFYGYLTNLRPLPDGFQAVEGKMYWTWVVTTAMPPGEKGKHKRQLIAEALRSYKSFHGLTRPNLELLVYFEESKSYE